LDVLVNCIGACTSGRLTQTPVSRLDEMFFANLRTMFRTCRAVFEQVERVTGQTINAGSRSVMVGVAYETSYCAIKYALRGFSDALREELKGSGVRVSCLHPGPTNTWDAMDGGRSHDARGGCRRRSHDGST
jgi:uncharacterized protein